MTIRFKTIALAALMAAASPLFAATAVGQEIPRAPSTPDTPKNWVAPKYKIHAQALVDKLAASHPEIESITIHAIPAGMKDYTMIAGTFPDRIGNTSSPGDAITAVKGVTQVESKWGTPNFNKKVSILAPVMDTAGRYLPAAMVIAFKQSPTSGLIDIDFLHPGVRVRNSIAPMVPDFASLFAPAK